ncbi:DUF222 domain-containing protein [Arthrobacter sp. JZ12]|uniref:HNH endonuclease signature motif containing protein n=1 Tax=Arthrobacter sp. JZ12 TaxID=2654190 RepID=UPI002B47DEFA|nr:DUF222 domain-containing protein [Arthrobacter sp. JZ12]WRH24590.1 DUF222 domain-containing protein [Arthrobacter sp. JZ12]
MESGTERILEDAYAEAALQWPDVPLEHLISDEDELEDPAEQRMRSAVEHASVYSLVSRLQGARSQESRSSRRLPDTLNLLRAAERLAAWAAAQRTRLVAEVYGLGNAANHSWSGEGDSLRFTEAATETAALLKLSEGAATRLVSESLSLTGHLQKTLTALEDGRICAGRTSVIVEQARTLPEEALPAFEREILESAPQLNRPKLAARCRRLREKLHPDTLSARRAQAFSDRRVVLEPAQDGMAWLSGYLPAEQAVAIFTSVDAAARNLRGGDESRTLAQLRADVFADTLLGSPSGGASGSTAKVLVTVPVFSLMGLTDEPAELEGYGPIPADVARELAANAPSFMRLLTHPYSGAVLRLDRTRYRPSEDLRTWVKVRDKTCSFYGCNRPASRCEIDHVIAWSEDGRTCEDNLYPLCKRHHMLKHQSGWTPDPNPSGGLSWTSPGGQTYSSPPEPTPSDISLTAAVLQKINRPSGIESTTHPQQPEPPPF